MDPSLQNRLFSADAALAVADEASRLPEATGDARAFRDLIWLRRHLNDTQ